jgi:CBS domain-containing protein
MAELEEEDFESFEVPEEAEETAADVMTALVHTVDFDTPLNAVAKKMVDLQIHRILVTKSGMHVGLISTFDVLRAVAQRKVS